MLKGDQIKSASEGFGLLAHWSFDYDYSSSVNNDLYQGKPVGGSSVQIIQDKKLVRIGDGALRLNSDSSSKNKSFVSIIPA